MLYPLSYGGPVADAHYCRAAAPTVVRGHTISAFTVLRPPTPCTSEDPRARALRRNWWAG